MGLFSKYYTTYNYDRKNKMANKTYMHAYVEPVTYTNLYHIYQGILGYMCPLPHTRASMTNTTVFVKLCIFYNRAWAIAKMKSSKNHTITCGPQHWLIPKCSPYTKVHLGICGYCGPQVIVWDIRDSLLKLANFTSKNCWSQDSTSWVVPTVTPVNLGVLA